MAILTKITMIFLLMVALPSWANDSFVKPRQGWGAGSQTCGAFSAFTADEELLKMMGLQWVEGYLSALNNSSDIDFLKDTDPKAIAGAVDLYCRNNPLDHIVDAAKSIYRQLYFKTR